MKQFRNQMKRLPDEKSIEEISKLDSLDCYPYLLIILQEIQATLSQDTRYNAASKAIEDTYKLIAEIDRIQRLNKLQQIAMALDVVNLIPHFEALVNNIEKIEYCANVKDSLKELRIWLEGAYRQGLISEQNDSVIASKIYSKLTGGYKKRDLVIYFHKAAEQLQIREVQYQTIEKQEVKQSVFYANAYMQREGKFGTLPTQPQQGRPHLSLVKPKV